MSHWHGDSGVTPCTGTGPTCAGLCLAAVVFAQGRVTPAVLGLALHRDGDICTDVLFARGR